MSRLLAAELLKLRTTRAPYVFVLVGVLLTGIAVAGTIAATPEGERTGSWQLDIVSSAGFGTIVALMLGVTLVTTEWRHGTITPAFLTTPVRRRLLEAKTVAAAGVGAALTALCLVVMAVIAAPWLAALGTSLELDGDTLGRAGRVLLAGALYGAFGAAVGVLVQNQAGAIVGVIIWILVVENLLALLFGVLDVDGLADVLPGRALSALDGSIEDGLSPWAGGLAALAWIVVILMLGIVRAERADVT